MERSVAVAGGGPLRHSIAATNFPCWKACRMLSNMESSEHPITPSEAQAAIADADSARIRLASSLRLPSYFYSSIGAAIAVQIGTGATGIANQETRGMVVLAGGVLVFVLVAAVQLARFRRRMAHGSAAWPARCSSGRRAWRPSRMSRPSGSRPGRPSRAQGGSRRSPRWPVVPPTPGPGDVGGTATRVRRRAQPR